MYLHVLVGLCAKLTSTMESNRLETMRLAWAVLSSCSSAIDATRSVFKTTSSFRTGVLVEKEEVAAPTEPHGLAVRAQAAAAAAACARTARPCGSVGAATSSFSTSTPVRKDDVVLKTDLVASIAEEHELKTAQANRIVSSLFDSIVEVSLAHRPTSTCRYTWCSLWALVVGARAAVCDHLFGSKKRST